MQIQDIKTQLSIEKVLSHYKIKLTKNKMANCPFHNDKTPSLQIYPKSNTFCCFSSNCTAGTGDQIQFIELMDKNGKHEAIEKAKSMLGYVKPVTKEKENYNEVFSKLKQNISKSKKTTEYLESRYLKVENLEIGYNANTFKSLKSCIVFPLKDKFNNVVSLYGRSVLNVENASHFYTADRKGIYPNPPGSNTRKLILTESIIDAATLLQNEEITKEYGIIALYGTNGLTSEILESIQNWSSSGVEKQEIILWFDGDEAGEKAAVKYSEELKGVTKIISQVKTPKGEDINSLLDGHSEEVLTELLNSRITFFSTEQGAPAGNLLDEKQDKLSTETHRLNTKNPEYITYEKPTLKCTLLGGISLQQIDRLRVTLLLERVPKLTPLHSIRQSGLDLYNDNFVEKFCRSAAEKLEMGTSEIRLTLAELTEELEKYRLTKMESKKVEKPKIRILNNAQKQKALDYLKSPGLLKRTNEDIGKSGLVGEKINRLLMYIVFTSRLREQPLHIISLGASGTGKTYLQEKIAELIPDQDKVEITVLSDNAFYYFDKTQLANKLILIEDMDGAENVLLPLRELMSKKKISKQVVIKDAKGNMRTVQLQVEGPICVAGTTTKERIYEDNANRSILIYRDNTAKHQEKIMDYQRELSAGQINYNQEEEIKEFFRDMQTLLKPIKVRNPYAQQLKIPREVFKPLRTNTHYLQFIECVTFYHQYQRTIKKDATTGEQFIETSLEDIAAANYLLNDVLLSKADELSGVCRKFFERLKKHLKSGEKRSFYAKEIRSDLRLAPTTLKRYLYQLSDSNYIKIVGGDKFRKGYEYEVVSYEEYQDLKQNIKTALDRALEKIKTESKQNPVTESQISSPVVHQ